MLVTPRLRSRNRLCLPIGWVCLLAPTFVGCFGLQGRHVRMPVNTQVRENAGFNETHWSPLAGSEMFATRNFQSPAQVSLPPIVESEHVLLRSAPRGQLTIRQTSPPRAISDSQQVDVRTASAERPTSSPVSTGEFFRLHDQSAKVETSQVEDLQYDYDAP